MQAHLRASSDNNQLYNFIAGVVVSAATHGQLVVTVEGTDSLVCTLFNVEALFGTVALLLRRLVHMMGQF
jgi:hypothetical protein